MGLLWLCWRMHGVHGFSAPTCIGCWIWERKMESLHWYLIPQIPWLGVSKDMFFQGYSLCSARVREKALLITSPPDVQGIPCFAFSVNFLNIPCIPVQPDATPQSCSSPAAHDLCWLYAFCELKWFLQLCKQEWSPWCIPDLSTQGLLTLPPARMSNEDPAGFSTLSKHCRPAVLHSKGGLHV